MSLELTDQAVLEPGDRSPEIPQMSQPAFKSDFLQTMRDRGYIHQITHPEELDEAASRGGPIIGYIGYDATAPSLHVGNLITIMMLRRLQQTGHKPIVIVGGGTTKVGDPSGKDETRKLLSHDDIQANIATQKQAFAKFLKFGDGPTDAVLVDNDEWLSKLGYIDFLRDYGVHFTINRMLAFDSVKLRLDREQPLTFIEFNYMLMQATDFLELNRRYGCVLQMGGSDQWGNIVNGVDLTRRVEGVEVFGVTTPLITTASGAKMGKTAAGAVWLNPDLLSPYDYWQFWRNTEDGDVGRFLRLYTDLPLDEIARLEALPGAEINDAKIRLANEATTLLHGVEQAMASELTARLAFKDGQAAAGLPTIEVDRSAFPHSRTTAGLVKEAGLAASLGEARRLIANGGVAINDRRMTQDEQHAYDQLLPDVQAFKVQVGKKKIVLVKPV